MRAAALLLLAAVLLLGLLALDRRSLERANRLYRAGRVEASVELYRIRAAGGRADPVAAYGLGTALLARGDPAAARPLRRAAEAADSALRQRAHYNLGYHHLVRAEDAGESLAALEALEAAVRHGRSAVALDPDDEDARWNLELAERRLEELLRREPRLSDREEAGEPEDLELDTGELVRVEATDSASGAPPDELPPSRNPRGDEEASAERVAVEGAEEARARNDPGPLEPAAALEIVRGSESHDAEHLVRRLLWVHRPEVAWWEDEPYPGGRW